MVRGAIKTFMVESIPIALGHVYGRSVFNPSDNGFFHRILQVTMLWHISGELVCRQPLRCECESLHYFVMREGCYQWEGSCSSRQLLQENKDKSWLQLRQLRRL